MSSYYVTIPNAAIECLDAIAQTLDASFRLVTSDRDLEGQRAIRVKHTDRCLGPRDADDSASTQDQ